MARRLRLPPMKYELGADIGGGAQARYRLV
jgi:hypothetical protein